MGIHNLLPFLRKRAPSSFKPFSEWKSHKPLKIAIDTPIFMYKYAYTVGTGQPLIDRMIRFAEELRSENIVPVFVFDGAEMPEKEEECTRRRSIRECKTVGSSVILSCSDGFLEMEVDGYKELNIRPTKKDYANFEDACFAKNIQTVRAKHEAEALCSFLSSIAECDGVLTEDSDALAYGCSNVIINWGDDPNVISASDAAVSLKLTLSQFQQFCVLLGNDFNKRVYGIGPVKSLKIVQASLNFEDIMKKLNIDQESQKSMKTTLKILESFCGEKKLE